jgi:alpha-1,3-rhamnosyl/mannosyltransferase
LRLAPTNLGWSLVDLPRAARRADVDLFHAPAYTAPLGGVRPLVLTIHDVSYERHPEWYPYRRDPLRRWFYRRSALAADLILTDSEFSRTEISAAYGIEPGRIRVVPLGVGAPFANAPIETDGPAITEPYLLHVGDLHPRRNLPFLVRAVGRAGPGRTLSLVLAGTDRGERARIEDEAARARVRVVFTAPSDDRTLARLYRGATAFVYASHYEGFGLPLLEAMACGVPIVATRAASIPEVVGDAGLLVDANDEEALAAAMTRVVDDAGLAETLRTAGMTRAATFSWERTARATRDVYRELAG